MKDLVDIFRDKGECEDYREECEDYREECEDCSYWNVELNECDRGKCIYGERNNYYVFIE